MNLLALGKNIQKARHDLGLSGEELSELCGITHTYLRQLESGRKTPSLPMFVTLCEKLKVSPSYLLTGNVNDYYSSSLDELIELSGKSSPSQLRLITALLKTALKELEP